MSKVVLDVSISLDGFSAGPNVRVPEPMGDGGERLHEWMAADAGVDAAARDHLNASVGATVIGRRTFDLGVGNWGGTPWPGVPSFVVTHRPTDDLLGDNGGTFAFADLTTAVELAKEAAGDKLALVMGADIAGQLLEAGLLDEVHVHVASLLLGRGTPLFGGARAELVLEEGSSGSATHLRYRVAKS